MYCVACGSLLPNEAQFCPRCGKRNGTEEIASGPTSSEASTGDESEASPSLPPPENGISADGAAPTAPSGAEEAGQSVSET